MSGKKLSQAILDIVLYIAFHVIIFILVPFIGALGVNFITSYNSQSFIHIIIGTWEWFNWGGIIIMYYPWFLLYILALGVYEGISGKSPIFRNKNKLFLVGFIGILLIVTAFFYIK